MAENNWNSLSEAAVNVPTLNTYKCQRRLNTNIGDATNQVQIPELESIEMHL